MVSYFFLQVAGISLHNFPEGMAVFLGSMKVIIIHFVNIKKLDAYILKVLIHAIFQKENSPDILVTFIMLLF